ncbi:hypothetical protein ACN9J3_04660 [Aliarcobacter butzleri]|uniref:hypothetical protein n=1 Tax=Aliarcobacter butzleri TaxID=28197 RepID=UPI003B21029F
MSIYKNALDSILLGLDDYKLALDGDKRRYISSTRNLFAGILLLFKEKLSQLSPDGTNEILIKKKIVPVLDENSTVVFQAQGDKTVEVQDIKELFKNLKISTDWKRVEKINKYRNNIEHYYSNEDEDSIRGLLSDCFLVIRDFISKELELDPKEELGQEAWEQLIDISEVFEAEKKDCESKLDELSLNTIIIDSIKEFHCENCLSTLITVIDGDIKCKSCENEFNIDSLIESLLSNKYQYSWYEIKNGGEPELIDCPFCFKHTYILSENKCMACEESSERECSRCGMTISWEEISDDNVCGYCSYMAEKYYGEDS